MAGERIGGRMAIDLPSPNSDARPRGAPIDMLVLHYTGMASAEAALARLTDPDAKVSAHWCVGEDGALWRLVPEQRRAWHAGRSLWRGRAGVNDRSIGIELVNPGHAFGYRPFPRPQMDALLALARAVLSRHPIPPRNVVAHADVAPLRRADPGELFDWERLAREGVGLWPREDVGLWPREGVDLRAEEGAAPAAAGPALRRGDRGAAVRLRQERLREFGYGIAADGDFGAATEAVVRAFQRHFRQARVDGAIDAGTDAVLRRLHARVAGA